jgi:hypothetical protein
MKNKIIKNKKNKMEKYILFSNLVELQALVQLYNVYSDIEEHGSHIRSNEIFRRNIR